LGRTPNRSPIRFSSSDMALSTPDYMPLLLNEALPAAFQEKRLSCLLLL